MFLVLLVVLAAIVAAPSMRLTGAYQFLAVQSGSMEPTIHRGSIIVIAPQGSYSAGDIVTVSLNGKGGNSVTHRITDVSSKDGGITYITKGDANDSSDVEPRYSNEVLGKVIVAIPLLGYLVTIARTQYGVIALVVIPAVMIVMNELANIRAESKKLLSK